MKYIRSHIWLYLLFLPGALFFIIFKYVPMFGAVIAFQNYSPFQGFLGSEFVGFTHFRNFFIGPDFWLLMKNTLAISFLSLILYFPLPIIIALFLNEIKNQGYKRAIQTLIYIPHFVSFVIVASLTYTLFNVNNGMIGSVTMGIGGSIIDSDFLESYLGLRVESVDEVEIIRRMSEEIYDENEFQKAMQWTKKM